MPSAQPAADKKPPATAAPAKQPAPAGAKPEGAKPAAAPSSSPAVQRMDRMAVRAKLAVSEPGDPMEQDADRAAARVMRMADDAPKSKAGDKPAEKKGAPPQEPVKVARQPQDAGPTPKATPTVSADFAKDLGGGHPLDPDLSDFFERRFGRDLSDVRIHDGAKADEAARSINARAFTFGRDIGFAVGEYQPQSDEGKTLLAHEIAHVLQQDGGVARMVMRQGHGASPAGGGGGGAATGGGAPTGAPEFHVTAATPLAIPPIKSRHSPTYQAKAGTHTLRRARGYDSSTRATAQVANWLAGVQCDQLSHIPATYHPASGSAWNLPLQKQGGAATKMVTAPNDDALKELLKRPGWDAQGEDKEFQVDHMVEFQLGGQDDIDNLELLDQAHNGSVGSSFNYSINRAISAELALHPPPAAPGLTIPSPPTAAFVKDNYDVVFDAVVARGRETRRTEGTSTFWSRAAINGLEQVTSLLPGAQGSLAGTAQQIVLQSPTGALVLGRFPVTGNALQVRPAQSGAIAGFTIESVNLEAAGGPGGLAGNALAADANAGRLEGTLNLGPAVTFPPNGNRRALALQKANQEFAVKIGSTPVPSDTPGTPNLVPATFTPLSPMEITDLAFGRGVFARAWIQPTHPALAGLRLPGEVRNGRVGIFYTVDATSLAERLRIPGLTMDAASITLGYDGTDFSVAGGMEFTIRNFGTGNLEAMVDTHGRFALEGGFTADPRLFDQATMRLWYRSETGFGGTGTLGITNPNKIRGIRSASVTATYDQGVFTANGTVTPSIPGVASAGLGVRYGPDESGADSLLITGDLTLQPGIPGINGGTVHVSVQQREDAWKVSAVGDIQPNLPGLNPNVHLTYDEGLFTGELTVAFERSIFSGNVLVGLTNRAVNPDGELSGTEPGRELRLYGNGTLTARLTEHLQGGVGVKVRPIGDLLISGHIGIADAVTLFDQYPPPDRATRELFHMPTVSIPLFGFAIGGNTVGIALTINGRITGHAFVGPGMLTQAGIDVIDFNPARPESLHITGRAQLNLPAEAGVDAAIDAGVSAGAAVVRVTAGLSVTAGALVRAEVTPSIDLDWTPDTGLHVHSDLNASLTPRLRFGVNGYAEVVVDAFVTSFTLWRKDWLLAQREVGSNLALGLNVPVDYYSDGRGVVFDPNRVTFQVPELNADTLTHLFDEPAGEHVEEPRQPAPDERR
jgi:hypothetical protein